MTTPNRIKNIQKRVKEMTLDSRVHFFDSTEEYEEAFNGGRIKANDVCIIDDIANDIANDETNVTM